MKKFQTHRVLTTLGQLAGMQVGLFILFSALIVPELRAQQDAEFTMYMFNRLAQNPAYTGNRERASVTGLFRTQWNGIEGSPNTQSLTAHAPLLDQTMGLGFIVMNDRLGDNRFLTFNGSYAYRLKLQKGVLAMGIQAGFTQYRADFTQIRHSISPNVTDPAFGQNLNEILPNFGFGVYYQQERFYLSASVPQMINNDFNDGFSEARQSIHYFLSSGYVINVNGPIQVKPSFLFKYVQGAPFSLDINTNVNLYDWFEVGVSYRWEDSIDFLLNVPVGKNFVFGYAYDFTITDLGQYNSGTHELMLRYEFNVSGNSNRILTPRYF